MDSSMTPNQTGNLGKSALTAGVAVLIMAFTVPVVEFYIFPKLIDYKNGAETTQNILNNINLFSAAIFIHFVTIICDITIAWALYIFLKPAHRNLSLLAAWFRLIYTAFNIVALLNLVQVITLLKSREFLQKLDLAIVNDLVLLHVNSFNLQWRFGLIFFGIYLCLLGYIVFSSHYVPKLIGIFLVIAGLGYLIDDLKFFFYPTFDTGFLWFTYFGELIFMGWLLIKGWRIDSKEISTQ